MPYADPEEQRAYKRRYYRPYNAKRRKANPAHYKAISLRSSRKHQANFPLAVYMYNRLLHLMDPERKRRTGREDYRRHPERYAKREAKRRMRIAEQMPAKPNSTAVAKTYLRASELRKWFAVVVDHIKPLCRDGLHEAKNLQIIYAVENARKGSRLDYTPSVIFA